MPIKKSKKQRHYFANKCPYSQSYVFSSSHVWMWELDHKEGWVPKNWWFWTVVLEKTLESPLDWKEIKLVNPKGNQSWIFIGRIDAEAEAPILWPPHVKSRLIRKDPDAGRDWGQEKKGMTEDEMAGWHHWLDGHESEWTPGVCDGQGGLACCYSWGRKESDKTERLNWTDAGKDWGQEEKGTTKVKMVGWYHRLNGQEFEQAPGDDEGQGSLACCSPWGRKESDTTEQLNNNA